MSYELMHPGLGKIVGNKKGEVIQFLGIKYGALNGRFDASQVKTYTKGGTVDATRHGPSPFFAAEFLDVETGFIQKSLPVASKPPCSDTEGLNLNITTPHTDGPTSSAPLPVLVYIHGGGFLFGSNWYPHYDQAKIVQLSIERNTPVVAVNINYRLGVPGFLTSEELRQAGYAPNNGLNDQKTALRWIKKNIAGFGGDPNNITLMGQSAGSGLHLYGSEALFEKAVMLSGTPIIMGPASLAEAEENYLQITRAFGLHGLSKEARLEALLNIDSGELIAKTPPDAQLGPVVDGELDTSLSFQHFAKGSSQILQGKHWCQHLMTTHSILDGSIITSLVLLERTEGIANQFLQSLSETLNSPSVVGQWLECYGIKADTQDADALIKVARLITDVSFRAPSLAFASHWPNAFVGEFAEGNPWDGMYKGYPNHMLDVAYVWQNYNADLSEAQANVARVFAGDILDFAVGKGSLKPFNETKAATIYGPSSESCVKRTESVACTNLDEFVDRLGGLDAVLAAVNKFLYIP